MSRLKYSLKDFAPHAILATTYWCISILGLFMTRISIELLGLKDKLLDVSYPLFTYFGRQIEINVVAAFCLAISFGLLGVLIKTRRRDYLVISMALFLLFSILIAGLGVEPRGLNLYINTCGGVLYACLTAASVLLLERYLWDSRRYIIPLTTYGLAVWVTLVSDLVRMPELFKILPKNLNPVIGVAGFLDGVFICGLGALISSSTIIVCHLQLRKLVDASLRGLSKQRQETSRISTS